MVSSSTQHSGSIGTVSQSGIPDEVDVAIVGSGGAGLMAALTAATEGARVLVVESREIVGGATGISAGAAWIPNHGFSTKDLKVNDDLDQARRYIYGQGRDQILDHDLVEKFLRNRTPRRPVHRRAHLLWVDPDDLAGLPLRHRRRVRRSGTLSRPVLPRGTGGGGEVRATGPDNGHGQEPAPVLVAGWDRHR